MTESEWLTATDSEPMLQFVRGKVSDRKLRLFACACCRGLYPLIPDRYSRKTIAVAERFADGEVSADKLRFAWESARRSAGTRRRARGGGADGPQDFALWVVTLALGDNPRWLYQFRGSATWAFLAQFQETGPLPEVKLDESGLIREVVGNPFHTAPAVDAAWLERHGAVAQLARSAYQERRLPEGTLDPARLSLLADALEDAGCTDAELLGHLRGPGPHVRGCWAVDLVLGKG